MSQSSVTLQYEIKLQKSLEILFYHRPISRVRLQMSNLVFEL